jgi:putative PIN family toxin of toxin-antitoxin system
VLQIVLDTNVLVAALRSKRGASYRLAQMIGTGKFQPNISVALALEYEDVLKRSDLLPDMRVADVDDFLDYIFKSSALVPFVLPRRPVLRDPGDESILEVAVECQAIIVTHNKRDFAGAERFGISVLTPGQFLRTIEENP